MNLELFFCNPSGCDLTIVFSLSLSQNMAVGPSLGLVKSSSLESLHNVMHHHIIRDIVDDGVAGGTRRGPHRNSFKRTAMDHSYGEANGEEEQRGVDGK